jgi:uncharacterized protein with PIN domain
MPAEITLRFYEELNDFLPSHKKKVPFVAIVKGNPAVKDVIESFNVPHTEIDLVLVNGTPRAFDYKIQDGDFISVFPVFELLNINRLKKPGKSLRITKFILDVHLGKLARYLRFLGFDTYYRNDLDDDEIIQRSVSEQRIILTRDKGILKNGSVTHGYYVRNQKPRRQLQEIIDKFDLREEIKPFSRCSCCNGRIKKVTKQSVINHLKPLTIKHFNEFYQCTDCKNVYWEGSHFEKLSGWIQQFRNTEE